MCPPASVGYDPFLDLLIRPPQTEHQPGAHYSVVHGVHHMEHFPNVEPQLTLATALIREVCPEIRNNTY